MSDIKQNVTDHLPMVKGVDDRFRGALVYKSIGQNINNDVNTIVSWGLESYDTDNFHDNVTNNSRFTIPSGISLIRLTTNSRWDTQILGDRLVDFRKNGVAIIGSGRTRAISALTLDALNVTSAVIDVVENDYLEVRVKQNSGSVVELQHNSGTGTWFAIEVIEEQQL